MADLIWVIYLLGLRISESFALEKSDIQVINKEEVATKKAQPLIALKIHQQYVRKQYAKGETDRLRELKNKRPRLATPLDQALFLKHFESWLKGTAVMKNSDPARIDPVATRQKRDTYRYALDRYLRDACRAMFQIEIEAQNSDDFFNLGAMPGTDDDREYKAAHMLRAGHAVYLMSVTKNVDLVANQIGDTVDVVRKHYSGRINTTMSMAEAAKLLAKAK